MSYRYYGFSAWVINPKELEKIAPDEYKAYVLALDNGDIWEERFCIDLECDSFEDTPEVKEVLAKWEALEKKFNETTGLKLSMYLIPSDDAYSDIDGIIYTVDGVMDFTEAGRKYYDIIYFHSWTEGG